MAGKILSVSKKSLLGTGELNRTATYERLNDIFHKSTDKGFNDCLLLKYHYKSFVVIRKKRKIYIDWTINASQKCANVYKVSLYKESCIIVDFIGVNKSKISLVVKMCSLRPYEYRN